MLLKNLQVIPSARETGLAKSNQNRNYQHEDNITPPVNAEKPAGQWQSLDVTLLDRHVTVVLNGTTIIDNEPLLGCTGGALWPDPIRPGPIYLQSNHGAASFRNIVLPPIIKDW